MEKFGIIIISTAAVIMLGIIAIFRMFKPYQNANQQGLAALKLRLAKGELTEEQYRHLKAVITEKP
jgi:uncharacterized membrane protein